MPTLIFGTGFEHQVAALGASHATGEALWDSVSGSPTISTSTKRTGVASLRINPAAFLQGLTRNIPAGNRRLVAVVHVNFAAFPPSFDAFILVVQSGAVVVKIGIRAGTNKWFAQVGSGTAQVSSSGPSLGTWYRVECRLDTSADPWTLDWRIDGVAETQATLATAADDIGTISFGHATGTTTVDFFLDDCAYSFTAGDYPIGDIYGLGYQPSADGTHSNAANFEDAGNVAISGSNPAYDQMDAVPLSAETEYVTQRAIGKGDYVEVVLADSAETTAPLHVQVSLAIRSDTATANNATYRIRDGSTDSDVYSGDPSETSDVFRTKGYPTKPSGGAWTDAAFDALLFRFGFSSDAAPDPRCGGVIAEALFTAAAGTVLAVGVGLLGLTGFAPTIITPVTVSVPAAALVLSGQAPQVNLAVPVAVGALVFTGQAPVVTAANNIFVTPPAGELTLTGQAPTILNPVAVPVPLGELTLNGQAPVLATGVLPDAGALALNGQAPTGLAAANVVVIPPVGELALTGNSPQANFGILPATGTLSLTGHDPTPVITFLVAVPAGELTLTGYGPAVNLTVPIATGELTLTGQIPIVGVSFTIAIPVGELTLTGEVPTILQPVVVSIPVGSLDLTGFSPQMNLAVPVDTGSLTLTGQVPLIPVAVAVPAGLLSFDGFTPQLHLSILVEAGSLSLSGQVPTVIAPTAIPVNTGLLTLIGHVPTVGRGANIQVPVGTLILNGQFPSVLATGPLGCIYAIIESNKITDEIYATATITDSWEPTGKVVSEIIKC